VNIPDISPLRLLRQFCWASTRSGRAAAPSNHAW